MAAGILGVAASRVEERLQASRCMLDKTPVRFENHESLTNAGILLMLPFLVQTGLFSYKKHYGEISAGYYYIDFVILLQAFMYLLRIKNVEQLKHHSPGELGRIMGLDRIPEARCLRKKLKEIYDFKTSSQWSRSLFHDWTSSEDTGMFYVDGHVKVYNGYKANLGKKHVSRQKLCLPGMQEFWVNNKDGLPYFYITGQVNEKLIEILKDNIVPAVLRDIPQKECTDPDKPVFTLVFDREAYSPAFFKLMWQEHRIAALTYRKNVKDKWDETCFQEYEIESENAETKMLLAEKEVVLNNVPFREIRRLSDNHQTSIITNNKKLSINSVAKHMFARWTQENFFKYMRQDYDFDRMVQYAIDELDSDITVVNPEYNKLTYNIKKIREKISRKMASIYKLSTENLDRDIRKSTSYMTKRATIGEELNQLQIQENDLIKKRKSISYKIKLEDMSKESRYNRLCQESALFHNIIKIVCYRAETAFANLFARIYKKSENEKRALVKSIIHCTADIVPDYSDKTLTVKVYSLPSPRMNAALNEICSMLNDTETLYPSTDLKLVYKCATL